LPRADAGAQDLVLARPVGGLRIGRRCPPQAAGLRNLSAVAIKCVTKIELGRDGSRWDARDHFATGITGTSATQAGFASATTPSSTVCSGRSLLNIATRNPG